MCAHAHIVYMHKYVCVVLYVCMCKNSMHSANVQVTACINRKVPLNLKTLPASWNKIQIMYGEGLRAREYNFQQAYTFY